MEAGLRQAVPLVSISFWLFLQVGMRHQWSQRGTQGVDLLSYASLLSSSSGSWFGYQKRGGWEIGVPLERGGVCYRQNRYQGAGDVDQLVDACLICLSPWVLFPVLHKLYPRKSSIWCVDTGRLEFQGHSEIHKTPIWWGKSKTKTISS